PASAGRSRPSGSSNSVIAHFYAGHSRRSAMTAIEENGTTPSDTLERPSEDNSSIRGQKINEKMLYIPDKSGRPPRKDNRRILFIGAGIVFVLLLLAFNGISKHPLSVQKNPAPNLNPQKHSHVENE